MKEKVSAVIFPPFVGTPWCAPIKVKHGDVSCRTPRGEHYRNVMGTRCKIRCKQGYEAQSSEVVCMASKHWSSNYACRGNNSSTRTHLTHPHACLLGSYIFVQVHSWPMKLQNPLVNLFPQLWTTSLCLHQGREVVFFFSVWILHF